MELKTDDLVVYRSAGVCRVIAIEEQCMDGEHDVLYYKLRPLADTNSVYYIPCETAEDMVRPLLTQEEVLGLIDSMPRMGDDEDFWKDNRRERKEMYSQILKGNDHQALVNMISQLYFRKQESEASGKRFSAMDENAMRSAENLMLQEFGIVLDKTPDEVRDYIAERVEGQTAQA